MLVRQGSFRSLTQITLPAARAGGLARRHFSVYLTVPSRISVCLSLLGISIQSSASATTSTLQRITSCSFKSASHDVLRSGSITVDLRDEARRPTVR